MTGSANRISLMLYMLHNSDESKHGAFFGASDSYGWCVSILLWWYSRQRASHLRLKIPGHFTDLLVCHPS
jgi:hypothetical protein